jgi:phage shock protein PspC (stress-responsive transcriptional regulator)
MPSSEPNDTPKLIRTRRGRLIGGVCSGLGAHFGVDPLLLRIAFVGATFFGGAGAWVYLAIVLLVPEEGATRAPLRMLRVSAWRTIAGVVVLVAGASVLVPVGTNTLVHGARAFGVAIGATAAVGLLCALLWSRLAAGSGHATASADRVLARRLACVGTLVAAAALLAVAGAGLAGLDSEAAAWTLIALGAVVLAAGLAGVRWTVLPALAFALPLATFTAAGVDLHGGLGEHTYRPRTLAQLRAGYRLGAGRLEVDLRDVAFPPGDTTLRARLGVGELVVLVPDQICVATHARIGGGFIGALDRTRQGLDVNWRNRPSAPARVPRLLLEGHVGMGAMFVVDRPLTSRFEPGVYGRNDACRAPMAVRQ